MKVDMEQLFVGSITYANYSNEKADYDIEIERSSDIQNAYDDIWSKSDFEENLKVTIDKLSPIIERTNFDVLLIEDMRGKEDFDCVLLSGITVVVTRQDLKATFTFNCDELGRRVLTFQQYHKGYDNQGVGGGA